MIKRIITALVCVLILTGCVAKSEKKKVDPATFEELPVRLYWYYRSNLQGKVISEGVSADGTFVYGRYIVQRTTSANSMLDLKERVQTYAATSLPFRTSYAELAAGGVFIEPFAAQITAVDRDTITIDKGTKDGVDIGYYAYICKNVKEDIAANIKHKIGRYMDEDINNVLALYVVISVEDKKAVLETRGSRVIPGRVREVYVQFGFPRKSKFGLIDNITEDVRDWAYSMECLEEKARDGMVDALVDFTDGDAAVVDELIKLLASDAPDDRYVAGNALRRLTDEKFGYEYDADPQKRAAAIARWKEWWAANRLAYSAKPPAFEENERKREKNDRLRDLHDW